MRESVSIFWAGESGHRDGKRSSRCSKSVWATHITRYSATRCIETLRDVPVVQRDMLEEG